MRVAVVNQHLADVVGGSELQCDLIARGLAARGHDVRYVAVATGRAGGAATSVTETVTFGGYEIVRAPQDADGLAAVVRETGADVVYWRFNRRGLRETARALRVEGIPLVVALAHVDDVTAWPSWPWPARGSALRDRASDLRSRVRWRRQRGAFRDVDAIASQREDLLGRIPLRTVPLQRYVPNMMLLGGSAPGEGSTAGDAAEDRPRPFDHPRPFVAWVANLKARKRPELLPALADALAPHGLDLVVAGPVQDRRVGDLVRTSPDHPNLHHVGALAPERVPDLLAAARCLAVTAMPEGFSNVMLQAWWHGTPTVSLDYDPDDLVRRRRLGAVADGDLARFHEEVIRFATDAALAEEAGRRARAFAHERFAPDAVLDVLERFLLDVRR